MRERWDRIVKKAFGRKAEIVFPRFFESKKNQVTLLTLDIDGDKRQIVAKYYVWGDGANEWKTLNRCIDAGIRVPGPVFRTGPVSFFEYVPGSTLRMLRENMQESFDMSFLGRWLGGFHRAFSSSDGTVLLKGDVMFPNFIFSEKDRCLYGIDFEEARSGDPQEELSEVLTSILSDGSGGGSLFLSAYLGEFPAEIHWPGLDDAIVGSLKRRMRYMPHMAEHYRNIASVVEEAGSERLFLS